MTYSGDESTTIEPFSEILLANFVARNILPRFSGFALNHFPRSSSLSPYISAILQKSGQPGSTICDRKIQRNEASLPVSQKVSPSSYATSNRASLSLSGLGLP